MAMSKRTSIEDINEHYAYKHRVRTGMYNKPYANFGYWPRPGMSIDEACDAMAELMARELEINSGDEILECGCGYGTSAIYLAEKYGPKKIVGLDVTSVRIDSGRQAVREKGLEDVVDIRFGDATGLEFPDGSFSKVMAIECAFHFDTRFDFFKEAFRVLRPGGILAIADIIVAPTVDVQRHTPDELREYLSADKKRYCDANLYNAEVYGGLLRKAGFREADIYSIRDKVVLQYADHVEKTIEGADPEEKQRRARGVKALRERFMKGGDYVVVRARK